MADTISLSCSARTDKLLSIIAYGPLLAQRDALPGEGQEEGARRVLRAAIAETTGPAAALDAGGGVWVDSESDGSFARFCSSGMGDTGKLGSSASALLRSWGRRHNPANGARSGAAATAKRRNEGLGADREELGRAEEDEEVLVTCRRWLGEVMEGGGGPRQMEGSAPGMDRLAFNEALATTGSAVVRHGKKERKGLTLHEIMARKWAITPEATLDAEQMEEAVERGEEGSARHITSADSQSRAEASEAEIEFDSMISSTTSALSKLNIDGKAETKTTKDPVWAVDRRIPDLEGRYRKLLPHMARTYPFTLDTFQKEAVLRMEQNESVFIAAHTSAGKTVAAEYAFALAMKHCTRAIYTSPIKTISNQKFRDFSEAGFDVGLLTGDVSIRPESSCLIMTTEILRSMLYKGADMIRDLEWVIFDEVHYVNDAERGVVWEEVIIMLPQHISMVLLSATVPNVHEFADWVGRTKQKQMFITGTLKRPVPLEHSLFYGGELFKIAQESTFVPEGYKAAKLAEKQKKDPMFKPKAPLPGRPNAGPQTGRGGGRDGGRGGGEGRGRGRDGGRGRGGRDGGPGGRGSSGGRAGGGRGRQQPTGREISKQMQKSNQTRGPNSESATWMPLIKILQERQLLPLVVFCFSKRRCDLSADALKKLDLTSTLEKHKIHAFFDRSLSRLREADRNLPQILRVRHLLKRGLGVHHAGLLPIVKECVEMLFCEGMIKILFSTETFAMGVNAPARTVAFQSLRKHDGQDFRNLLPGEYTQMAGRAGRRGLDTVGTVIIMCGDDVPDELTLRKLLIGKATRLQSRFRLRYNMILNLLRVEDLTVEDMLKRSFAEFHAQRALPAKQRELKEAEATIVELDDCSSIIGEAVISEYHHLGANEERISKSVAEIVENARGSSAVVCPGRYVLVRRSTSMLPEPGIILASSRRVVGAKQPSTITVLLLSPEDDGKEEELNDFKQIPMHSSLNGVGFALVQVEYGDVCTFYREKTDADCASVLSGGQIKSYVDALCRFSEGLVQAEQLDPVRDLKIRGIDTVEDMLDRQRLVQRLTEIRSETQRCPKIREEYAIARRIGAARDKIASLKYAMSDAALQQMPEFHQRADVMRQMGYLSINEVVELKGRVACEINSGDELLATEIIFGGVLDSLTPAEAVSLLSCLVFQEKSQSEVTLTSALQQAHDTTLDIAKRAADVQEDCGLHIDNYVKEVFNPNLMEVVYEWARGTQFGTICTLTDVMEGSIVRTMVRLDETCREFRNAARVCGNLALYEQMEEASSLIKRDVTFAASLYVT